MVLHRRNNRCVRQFQVAVGEATTKSSRVFNEEVDFFQQIVVMNDSGIMFLSQGFQLFGNHGTAFILVNDNEVIFHGFNVVSRMLY